MTPEELDPLFSDAVLKNLFPEERSDRFFAALYGDASEGAYDIDLAFNGPNGDALEFQFNLRRRPDKCLACNLTYGLPHVFNRHPVINAEGLVKDIEKILAGRAACKRWRLGETREISGDLHIIPLIIEIHSIPSSS